MLTENTRAQLLHAAEFSRLQLSAVHAYAETIARYLAMAISAVTPPATPVFQAVSALKLVADGREFAQHQDEAREAIQRWQQYPDAKFQRFREFVGSQQRANDTFKSSLAKLEGALREMEMQGCK